jgi:hypothetical protein
MNQTFLHNILRQEIAAQEDENIKREDSDLSIILERTVH